MACLVLLVLVAILNSARWHLLLNRLVLVSDLSMRSPLDLDLFSPSSMKTHPRYPPRNSSLEMHSVLGNPRSLLEYLSPFSSGTGN